MAITIDELEKLIVAGKNISITSDGETLTIETDLLREIPILAEDELLMAILFFVFYRYKNLTLTEAVATFKEFLTFERLEAAYKAFTQN